MSLGFTKSKAYPNLYFKVMDDEPIILLLYVDDLFRARLEKKEKQLESSQARRKMCGIFQMDLQDKTYSLWKYQEVQIQICGQRILSKGNNRLSRDIFSYSNVHFYQNHHGTSNKT